MNKGAIMWISSALALVVTGGGAIGVWSDYGWVTRGQYADHATQFVATDQYLSHVAAFQTLEASVAQLSETVGDIGNLLKGYSQVDRAIRNLLRAECMGARNLRPNIEAQKREFRRLTGEEYTEPPCEELLLPGDGP